MLTTETLARGKWCPLTGYRAINPDLTPATRCIGPDCMAWRWSAVLVEFGHCGLAGAPVCDKAEKPATEDQR